jgi:hypothetical protein
LFIKTSRFRPVIEEPAMSRVPRRRIFVDTEVQNALARRVIVQWACFLLVASVATFLLQVLANPFRPRADHVAGLWWTQGPLLLVAALLLPAFVVDTVRFSYRFAGPISNLRRAMREIDEGRPARTLILRDGDFWHELVEDFNALLLRVGAVQQDNPAPVHEQNEPVADEPLVGTPN